MFQIRLTIFLLKHGKYIFLKVTKDQRLAIALTWDINKKHGARLNPPPMPQIRLNVRFGISSVIIYGEFGNISCISVFLVA